MPLARRCIRRSGSRRTTRPGAIAGWENFRFFGAPVGLFFVIDRRMGHGQWAHLGMFMMAVALAAEAEGLGTCMQEAWARVRETLHAHLGLGEQELIYCGMALGWPDPAHPSAAMVRTRAEIAELAEFRGFGEQA